jgi:hypothetical protein
MGLKSIDRQRLEKPSPHFRLLMPSQEKFDVICDKLLHMPRYLSDECRTRAYVTRLVNGWFGEEEFNLCYEINEMDGVLVFQHIYPTWRARIALKLWNDKCWNLTLAREIKTLIALVCDQFDLVKVETATADQPVVKMGKVFGFTVEGILTKSFKWDNVLYDFVLMGFQPGKKEA